FVESLLPLLLMFAVMMLPLMFMSSRQKKAQRQQQERDAALGIGDEVRTHSGLYGLIVDEFDDLVILESEAGAQTTWARQAIAQKGEDAEPASAGGAIPGVTVDDERDDDRRDR